jgi:hypothetical protein
MAQFDMSLHGPLPLAEQRSDAQIRELFAVATKEAVGLQLQEGTNYAASWYHMAIGYDAGYFGKPCQADKIICQADVYAPI